MGSSPAIFVTIEKAVACLVNLDYIPQGFSLLDITEAFREYAEVEYENGRIDRLPLEEQDLLQAHFETCEARHQLAKTLLAALALESKKPDSTMRFQHATDRLPRVALNGVKIWSRKQFGIACHYPEGTLKDQAAWADVIIKIYANYRLGWRVGDGPIYTSCFEDIGLIDKRTKEPNHQGLILIWLAQRERFPQSDIDNKHKAAISRLRDGLKRLTGISADPFTPYNATDGWRPSFKLIDDRRNADERAKAQAQHVPYDDTRDYQAEDDDAGEWLEQNE